MLVGDVSVPVSARGEAVVGGLGEPPYAVTLETPTERVTVIGVEGPVVDLGGVIDGPTPLRGRLVELLADVTTAVDAGTSGDAASPVEVVARAFTDRQVVVGRELRPGRWAFEVPAHEGRVEIVAVWSARGRPLRFARAVVPDASRQATSILALEPEHAFDERVVVSVDRAPSALVAAELTYAGQPTGLRLGDALAEPGLAANLPRPGAGLSASYGLWITATARRPGGDVVAAVGEQLPIGSDEHVIRWPAVPEVAPVPTVDAADALPLGRRAATMSWTGASREATWVEASLVGDSGCGTRRWRVIAPAEAGEAVFPGILDGEDVLKMSVISGRFETVSVADRTFADMFAAGATPFDRLPAEASRIARRAVVGWWRGETPGCDDAPLAGRYAVVAAAARDGLCGADVDLTEGLVDRCGRWVPLSDGGPGGVLRCARLDGDRVVFPSGAARRLRAVDWGRHDAHAFDQPDGARVMVVATPPPRRVQAAVLVGTWRRVTIHVRHYAVGEEGARGPALEDPQVLFSGEAEAGPWLEVTAGGAMRVVTPDLALRGVVSAFDGRRGELALQPDVCTGAARTATLLLTEGGALGITFEAPGRHEGEPAVRVTSMTFRR